MTNGPQAPSSREHTGRHRIFPPSRPQNERHATAEPNHEPAHPTGNWRAQITIAERHDHRSTIGQQTAKLHERIVRWLTVEGLCAEVARFEPIPDRVALVVTCSSRCKHRLRAAFRGAEDLEVTSGDVARFT
jgi:hypothetical protein